MGRSRSAPTPPPKVLLVLEDRKCLSLRVMRSDSSTGPGSGAVGREFVYWIAKAAEKTREGAGVRPERIAGDLNTGVEKIRRFESVSHLPRNLDEIITTYAQVAGLADSREIYELAVRLWHEQGRDPMAVRKESADGVSNMQIAETIIREQVDRDRRRAARASAERPKTTRKKRAAS